MNLSDTSCIVTGGAIGIGKAIAVRLASLGAGVCIADMDFPSAEATASAITASGGKL
jgi:NAD(P)-dependent dehydrogenase (short-subunit alcohol dehydrogenase family)